MSVGEALGLSNMTSTLHQDSCGKLLCFRGLGKNLQIDCDSDLVADIGSVSQS